jgi:metallo-beta-lactamase family protein
MEKSRNYMKVKFLGATHQVTGSSYFLDAGGVKFLIDCGMFQEREYSYINWKDFPIPPEQIRYLLLTHVHLDHSGLIPKIVKKGFTGDILLTQASKELLPIVLYDSARMQEEDAIFKKKRHDEEGREGPYPDIPLYTVQDVDKCLPLMKGISYGDDLQLNDGVRARFHDAGHILGSAMIEIAFQDEDGPRNIVFSGDIGQWDKPLLGNPSVFDRADYVVMESTYGDRNHDDPHTIDDRLCEVVNSTVKAGGNVLIPTSAIDRAQELMYHFSRLAREGKIPYITTFLDSPMAVEVTKVYDRCRQYFDQEALQLFEEGQSPFDFPGLELVETVEESKAINLTKGPTIIMAGSGMITGGCIKHHLIRNIDRPECTLLFVGYQSAGTLGRQILDGSSPVRILGQFYPVQIRIEEINAFSGHAGMDDLHRWVSNFKSPPKHIFLIHGEEEAILSLENYIQAKGGWEVCAPTYMEEYDL